MALPLKTIVKGAVSITDSAEILNSMQGVFRSLLLLDCSSLGADCHMEAGEAENENGTRQNDDTGKTFHLFPPLYFGNSGEYTLLRILRKACAPIRQKGFCWKKQDHTSGSSRACGIRLRRREPECEKGGIHSFADCEVVQRQPRRQDSTQR